MIGQGHLQNPPIDKWLEVIIDGLHVFFVFVCLFVCFLTLEMNKLGKIRRHNWKGSPNIGKLPDFKVIC